MDRWPLNVTQEWVDSGARFRGTHAPFDSPAWAPWAVVRTELMPQAWPRMYVPKVYDGARRLHQALRSVSRINMRNNGRWWDDGQA